MEHADLENVYRKIILLSNTERDKLYNRMTQNFYQHSETVDNSTNNKPLTMEQYKQRVNQCISGKSVDLEVLTKELGYNYVEL